MAAATAAASKLKKGPEAGPSAPEVPTEVVVQSSQSTATPSQASKPKQSSGGMKLQKKEPKEINWDAIVPETQKEASEEEEEGNGWGKGVKLTFNRSLFIFNLIFSHGKSFRTILFLHVHYESNSHYELITSFN